MIYYINRKDYKKRDERPAVSQDMESLERAYSDLLTTRKKLLQEWTDMLAAEDNWLSRSQLGVATSATPSSSAFLDDPQRKAQYEINAEQHDQSDAHELKFEQLDDQTEVHVDRKGEQYDLQSGVQPVEKRAPSIDCR